METLKLTVRNSFDRKSLIEGRNFGIGFAYVTPTTKRSKKTFKTMQAFTACKDYLNDLVYVEHYNKPLGKIHGFQHIYTGEFKDKDFVYLGAKVVHYNNSSTWKDFAKASKVFSECKTELIQSINKLEDLLGLSETRTILYGITATEYIFKVPHIWVERGWLTSLLTLWIRCFFNLSKKDAKLPIEEMVKAHENKIFISSDKYLFATIKEFIKRTDFKDLMEDIRPKIGDAPGTIHNLGIANFIKALKKPVQNEEKKAIAQCS